MERSEDEEMVTSINFFLGILCAWQCASTGVVAHVGAFNFVSAHVSGFFVVCIFLTNLLHAPRPLSEMVIVKVF